MTEAAFERARLSRDARFDGRFFVGVKTTGIYCRPICPATPPKSENVEFFPTAAAASEAGFRPCLRCRPECAPGTPAWAGTSTTVSRGLRLIAEGALEDGNVERLADRLGVTSRHLRRLFTRHVGASPLAVAHTQRLHFAKRLIDQTTMAMQEIALVAGYGSVRRFNDAFRQTYGRSPRELRRKNDVRASDRRSGITLRISYRTPFDWDSLLGFFAARAIPGVEQINDDTWSRTIVLDDQPGIIEVRNDAGTNSLELTVHGAATQQLFEIVQRTRQIFDVDAPVDAIASVLGKDTVLETLQQQTPGLRVPGAWSGFELTVRAIVGQQVSVAAATTLAGRIAERYGTPARVELGRDAAIPTTLFPTPEKLMRARFNDMGLVGSRIETIRRVAGAVARGALTFEGSQDHDEFCRQLTAIRGIGEWTAEYIAMRALKHPDAFPASDLGLLRAFDEPGQPRMKPAELKARAEAWRPWRSYAALLLWSRAPGSGG
ncbi:MAG: DNA-3-methyladenine glycosylase 2 family protein [Woeseiaceae bacterium]|nr:DNA-3-methyladenine glycosylase 2 family protein [Woeseiaceae bacterium]